MKTPAPQSYLTKEGKVIYAEMCKLLEDYEAIEEIDSYGLSMAAHWLWLYHDNAKAVSKTGGRQVTKTGYSQVTAEVTIMKTATAAFKDLSAKFGLSNKDRELMLKFKAKKDEGDALDELD